MSDSKDEWSTDSGSKSEGKGGGGGESPLDEAKGIDQAGSRKMYEKMVDRFKRYMPDMIAKVEGAHKDRDLKQLHAEVHSLKGSSGYAAASKLKACAVILHEASADDADYANDDAQWAACDDAIDRLVKEAEVVRTFLDQWEMGNHAESK
jgi:HPt (histidine-containing phosphotransfer) domain-containing protein